MASWLREHRASRSQPRLWIERLWLIESKEPLITGRMIELHPGVNIVWAREPDTGAASGLASAGHGVGKTSFCLLLRYCLGDEAPSIATLREKAASAFPKGGIAAKVHIDGTAWLVYRPYGAHLHSVAGRGESLESLLAGTLDGDFASYTTALHEAFIAKLAAPSLPGSNQPIEWRHLLAWCVRDQKTRFDGFFHWRDGDGLGFRRSRQDPPLFVHSVLGLLDSELDRLMRAVEATRAELTALEENLPKLERAPIDALAHQERQLRVRLGAGEDVPVHADLIGVSLETMVSNVCEKAEKDQADLGREIDQTEKEFSVLLEVRNDLKREAKVQEAERDIAQALSESNEAEYTRLTNELKQLDQLAGRCRHGDVEFSACQHIVRRRTTPNLPWRMDQKDAEAAIPRLRNSLEQAARRSAAAAAACQVQQNRIVEQAAIQRRLYVRRATSETQTALLQSIWDEFLTRKTQREKGDDSPELVSAKSRKEVLQGNLNSEEAALLKRSSQRSERAEALKAMTRVIADRLLGEEGHARFLPESDDHPFDLAVGGEAYQVLEVLLGDIACLLDSATSTGSNHPGFTVHDCPREADMSERLYREFLLMTAEAEVQLNPDGAAPFQYIVTTTSAPPAELQNSRNLVLELRPGTDEGLLFKRPLTTSLLGASPP